jgi:hypothetical protein
MLLANYHLLWVSAGVLTLAWLFLPMRITTTSALSMGIWFWLALTGDSLVKYTQTGTEIAVTAPGLQYPALALGVLSLLVVLFNWFGLYPPEDDPDGGENLRRDAMPSET